MSQMNNINKYTSKQDLIRKLELTKPKIILLSGRTCTGKTTLSKELSRELDMKILELDDFVLGNVIEKMNLPKQGIYSEIFKKIYSDENNNEYQKMFIDAFREFLLKNNDSIIIEGSIHNPKIIKLLGDDFEIVFLHPVDLKSYSKRVQKRFESGVCDGTSGLTNRFWDYVTKEQIGEYCKTKKVTDEIVENIAKFSLEIQDKSLNRINKIASFSKIKVLEV